MLQPSILCFWLSVSEDSRGLQIEFRRVPENGGMSVVNDVEVNADSTDKFQVVCRINNLQEFFKFNTIKLFKSQTSQVLAQMQNIDTNAQDTFQKPVLGPGVTGWTPVGEYDKNNVNARDSYVGVERSLSGLSCSDAVTYRCEASYSGPSPDFSTYNVGINKTLSVQGKNYCIIISNHNLPSVNLGHYTPSDSYVSFASCCAVCALTMSIPTTSF